MSTSVGDWTLPGEVDDALHEEADNRIRLADVLHLVHELLHHADVVLRVHEEMLPLLFFCPFFSPFFPLSSTSLVGSRSEPGLAVCE